MIKAGDKVVTRGVEDKSRPGIVLMVTGDKAVVTWKIGTSNWNHNATHTIDELEIVDVILEVAKFAQSRGTLDDKLKRVYKMNKAKQYRMEEKKKAAAATATRERLFEN